MAQQMVKERSGKTEIEVHLFIRSWHLRQKQQPAWDEHGFPHFEKE